MLKQEFLSVFEKNIREESDIYCSGLNCADGCMFNKECTKMLKIEPYVTSTFIRDRNNMIKEYVNTNRNLEQW